MNQYRPQAYNVLPEVTKNLLIINALMFVATYAFQAAFNIDLVDILGLHYWKAADFAPYQLVSYMFMHGSVAHIFFNMFALWMFGSMLENTWGPKRFLLFYMATGMGAALIHYLVVHYQMYPLNQSIEAIVNSPTVDQIAAFISSHKFRIHPELDYEMWRTFQSFQESYNILDTDPSNSEALLSCSRFLQEYREYYFNLPVVVGASGAVFGLLLAFGMIFPNMLLYIYFLFPIKAKYFVIIYGLLELYLGFANNPGDNVAHFAHLGGMVVGFILIKLYGRK